MSVTISREGRGYLLATRQHVPRPLQEVFDVFANAHNLEEMTPPALRFEILTPDPIVMGAGLLIDYRLRLHGVPFRWQSEITAWDPPFFFEDQQRKGPYRWWIHAHRFVADSDGTLVTDQVRYGVPGGAVVNELLVAPDLRKIFEFRAEQLRRLLGLVSA